MASGPNLENSWLQSGVTLKSYLKSLSKYKPEDVGDVAEDLRNVGAYQGFDWQNPLSGYNLPTYTALSGYERPEYERTDFSDPTLDEIESVSPLADELYEGQIAKAKEGIARGYKDTKQQVLDEVTRNKSRGKQAAALLANLGVQQSRDERESARDIGFEQAKEKLGLAQTEQQLNASRSSELANLLLQAQQAQAGERGQAAQFGQSQQEYEQAQKQYEYEQGLDSTKYQAGIDQYLQEQKAAEEQAKYQSAYAYAQDLGQAKLNRYDTNRAANMDYLNARLQGQQAAAQRFSQGATYTTNLTEKERKGMTEDKNYWSDVSPYSTYTSTKNPYSTMTSTNSSYNMPSTNTRTMTSVMTQKKPRTQTTTQGGY